MSNELLPCEKCGNPSPDLVPTIDGDVFPMCYTCGYAIGVGDALTSAEAVALWNRRPLLDSARAEAARLREWLRTADAFGMHRGNDRYTCPACDRTAPRWQQRNAEGHEPGCELFPYIEVKPARWICACGHRNPMQRESCERCEAIGNAPSHAATGREVGDEE